VNTKVKKAGKKIATKTEAELPQLQQETGENPGGTGSYTWKKTMGGCCCPESTGCTTGKIPVKSFKTGEATI